MPTPTLPISDLVSISVSLATTPAQGQNLSNMLILGSSTVIDVVSRMRSYSTLAQIATDFGTSAPEYLAANLWFQQAPQPTSLLIGRWAQNASAGQLFGASLNVAGVLATLQGVSTGSLKVTIDGGSQQSITGLNFTAITNLNGATTVIGAALTGSTIVFDAVNSRFVITSNTTGAASTVTFATAGASGTDISSTLGLRSTSSGAYQANGIVAETAITAVTYFDTTFGQQWYGLTVLGAADADHTAIAPYIEGANNYHFYVVSTQSAGVLVASTTTDIAYVLAQLKYNRTAVQFSSTNPYSGVSLLGRILTVDYTGNNTVITLMYKQEPGIVGETLNETQMASVIAKNANAFVTLNNNTAIIRPGVCTSGNFIDTIVGAAALVTTLQTTIYNALYTSPTKIPQTNAGMNILVALAEQVCSAFVNNGLLAPGTWTTSGFGVITTGSLLSKGYYVFAPPVSTQSAANRAARLSVPIQVAAKLAGAVHQVNLAVTVNA